MQEHEDERRRRIEEDLDSTQNSQANVTGMEFTFKPVRARSVPNFRKLQKDFVTKME